MSTPDPLDDMVLPYSVALPPQLNVYGFGSSQTLPAGVVLIRITYDGPERVRYRLDREVAGEQVQGQWRYVIESADPGTPRSSQPIEVSLAGPSRIHIQANRPIPQETVDDGYMAGMTVIPMGSYTP